jgi:AmmeMemoRadiSam system protein A
MEPTPSTKGDGQSLTAPQQRVLLRVARASIEHGLNTDGQELSLDPDVFEQALRAKGASFVTLHQRKELRGCIGSLEASRPWVVDVAHNAHAAAFRDPRFSPLRRHEFSDLVIHLSLLSAPQFVRADSEAELVSLMEPGVHGLVIEEGSRRATFLPSVWEQLPDPWDFLAQLKLKAGLPANYWSPTLKAYRYTVESVS